MLLVNFASGPGAGKSTTSAYVFAKLKMAGVKAELVGEEAKDLVYNQAIPMLDNQILILGEQYQRTKRLQEAGAEVAICDSPFVLSLVYSKNKPYHTELAALARKLESLYPDTVNIYIKRVKPYMKFGRYQEAEAAAALDQVALSLINPVHLQVTGDEAGAMKATSYILELLAYLHQNKETENGGK